VKGMSLISSFKGWVGEMQGSISAKIRLDSQIYRSINNVPQSRLPMAPPRLTT
jgi:hypothetical protein